MEPDGGPVASTVVDGMRDYNGDEGWGVQVWAQCDPAELPASVLDPLGVGVWQDPSGARVPVTTVRSFPGPEHCDWQDITFLWLGPEPNPREYLRDTTGKLASYLRTTYDGDAQLPEDAEDTGYHRNGRELWLEPQGEAAYVVSLDDPKDIERWPASAQSIGCA